MRYLVSALILSLMTMVVFALGIALFPQIMLGIVAGGLVIAIMTVGVKLDKEQNTEQKG